MSTMTLLQRRKLDTMRDIAVVALDLFVRDGFEETTVESIAAAAGCSPRTFYRYFGTKEDVIFHDLPEVIEGLGTMLDARLAAGQPEWSALSESMVEFIGRFDTADQLTAIRRMDLWLHEPALHARYLQYVDQAESTVLTSLCRHRRSKPDADDLAQLMAVCAVGAYRITMVTHRKTRSGGKLTAHLRESLAMLEHGFA